MQIVYYGIRPAYSFRYKASIIIWLCLSCTCILVAYCDQEIETSLINQYGPDSYPASYRCLGWNGNNSFNEDSCSPLGADYSLAQFHNITEYYNAISELISASAIPSARM